MGRKDWPLLKHPDIADPIRVSPEAASYYQGRGWEPAPEPERPATTVKPDDPAPTPARRRAAKSSEED